MRVKDNKVLAAARKELRRDGLTTKAQIKAALQAGAMEVSLRHRQELCVWCGVLPLAKGKTVTVRRPTPFAIEKQTANAAARSLVDNMATAKTPVKRAQPNKKKTPVKTAMKKGADIKKKATPKKKLENNQVRKKTRTGTYGGARKNSGRKVGAATKKTREIADKLAESSDITPLSYMLEVLNTTPDHLKKQYDAGDLDTVQYTLALADLTKRRDAAAKDSAVYIHPRLSSIEASVGLRGQDKFVDLMLAMDKQDG